MSEPMHVDYFIDSPSTDPYASFVLNHFRLSAALRMKCGKWMRQFKLFCTYEGKRYRVTYASRMGDVCLSADFNQETGYELRVGVDSCSEWGAEP